MVKKGSQVMTPELASSFKKPELVKKAKPEKESRTLLGS
jgi:hypothetical protein